MSEESQILVDLSLYRDVVVPLGATFIGGLFGVMAGLLVAAKSEKFRKLASWEPYAKDLWGRQVDLTCEILTHANKALGSALQLFDVFNPDTESRSSHAQMLNEELDALDDLKGKRLAICTANFNQSVEEFGQQLGVIIFQFAEGKLNQALSGNLPALWFSVVDDARTELRVERLDSESRAALEKASKAPVFDPTGNPTLPY